MKKLIFYLCFALMLSFSACSTDVNTTNWSDVQKEAFINDFNSTFNVSKTDYVNHQWGMNLMPLIDITNQTTRSVNANGNQWEDQGYIIPDDITDDELASVLEVFNQKGKAEYTSLINWDCYFVQQVYKGTAKHPNNDGGTVVGSEHMDWLCTVTNKHVNVISNWPYKEEIVIGDYYDDHINNFNNGNATASWISEKTGKTIKEMMLMVNTDSKKFGFKSSEDNGHVFYNFRMEKINGNYYVGFDFEANGVNKNEQVPRDYIYNDWIVKIVPGTGISMPDVNRVRVMCEDLGSQTSDFDYNDVVFDIKFIKNNSTYTADIILQAAGGTLPLTIGGYEVHKLFADENPDANITVQTMINTYPDKHTELNSVHFTINLPKTNYNNAWDAINDLPVIVLYNNTPIQLTVNPGEPAEMIAVPSNVDWSNERVSITNNYPAFVDWIRDSSIQWWE